MSLEKTIQEHLIYQRDNLELIKKHADNPIKVNEYADMLLLSLKNAQMGIKQEAKSIGANIQSPIKHGPSYKVNDDKENKQSNPTTALEWEKQGFNYLLTKKLNKALDAFTQAEIIWPDFHNVSEIRALLAKEKSSVNDEVSINWRRIYKTIIEDYSWGMPPEARKTMQQLIEKEI